MATANAFAPPTAEELSSTAFAPPTPDELGAPKPPRVPRAPIEMPDWSPTARGVFEGLTSIPGVGLAQNAAEGLWNSAAKIPAGVAGLLGTMLPGQQGQGARTVEGVKKLLSVAPSRVDDPIVQGMGKGAELANRALAPADHWLDQHPSTQALLGGASEAAGDLTNVLGTGAALLGARAPVTAARAQMRAFEKPDTVEARTNALGVPTPPSAANPTQPPPLLQKIAGVKATERRATGIGAENINKAAVEDMNLPAGTKLDMDTAPQAFHAADNAPMPQHGVSPSEGYTRVAAALGDVPIAADSELQSALQAVVAGKPGSPVRTADIAALVKPLADLPALSGDALLGPSGILREWRASAAKYNRSPDVAQQERGSAMQQVADALEDAVDRNLQQKAPDLLGVYQDSRMQFAKNRTYENAMDGDFINPQAIKAAAGRAADSGRGFSGVTQAIADTAEKYPRIARLPQKQAPDSGMASFLKHLLVNDIGGVAGNVATLGVGSLLRRSMTRAEPNVAALRNAEQWPSQRLQTPEASPWPPNTGPAPPAGPPVPESMRWRLDNPPRGNVLELSPDELRLGEGNQLQLEGGDRPNSLSALLDPRVGLDETGLGRGIQSDFASQLGPVSRNPGLNEGFEGPGIPARPRGVAGPRSAQLSDPQLPEGLQLFGETPPGNISDQLSLAPDTGPARSRVDITEQLPSQGSTKFPDRYRMPGVNTIEGDNGYISYKDNGDTWQIRDAFVRPDKQGSGIGQSQLLDLATQAAAKGKTLNSDIRVSPAQHRVYERLHAKGKLDFEGPFDSGPVYRNIRPGSGISDLLGP